MYLFITQTLTYRTQCALISSQCLFKYTDYSDCCTYRQLNIFPDVALTWTLNILNKTYLSDLAHSYSTSLSVSLSLPLLHPIFLSRSLSPSLLRHN